MWGLVAAAVLPVLFYLFFVYKKDSMKEPVKILLKCFVGGMFSIILSLLISVPVSTLSAYFVTPEAKAFFTAFMQAAIPEETAKLAVLFWLVWKSKDFDQHYDGIVYAVFVSLGFAMVENIMYVVEGGLGVAVIRAVLSVPGHGFFGVFMGYHIALARFHSGSQRTRQLLLAFLVPVILHGIFDYLLFYSGYVSENSMLVLTVFIAFFVFIVWLWRAGWRRIQKLVKDDLQISG